MRRTRAPRRSGALAALALLAALPSVAAGRLGAQSAVLQRTVRDTVLPNGLTVIVAENHAVPLATVEVAVRNGAFTQGADEAGAAHLFEHLLFKGYDGGQDPSAFGIAASQLHAGYNGTTSYETVSYFLTLPSANAEGGIEVLARMLRHPTFDRELLTRERFVVLGEYQRDVSRPLFKLNSLVEQRLWTTQWNRKNTIGDETGILGIAPERLASIYHRYYVPNNAALIVTGDVVTERVFAAAAKRFGGWKRAPDPFADAPVPPMPPLPVRQRVLIDGDVDAVTVQVEWQGPSVRGDRRSTYAADVFCDILNQPGSRFQRKLVDSGLFQSLHISYLTLDHTGPVELVGETTPERLRDAIRGLEEELLVIADPGYVTADEVALAAKRRAVDAAFELEHGTQLAHTIGYWWTVADLDYYRGYVDAMARQTPEDLQAFVARYLDGQPNVIGVLVPAKARQAMALTPESVFLFTEH